HVQVGVNLTLLIPRDDDVVIPDVTGDVVSWSRNLRLVREEAPGLAENPLELQLVDLPIIEDPGGNPALRDAFPHLPQLLFDAGADARDDRPSAGMGVGVGPEQTASNLLDHLPIPSIVILGVLSRPVRHQLLGIRRTTLTHPDVTRLIHPDLLQ